MPLTPNLSMNNFYNQINILLDEVAPYKKLTKKEIKLKSKPWITIDIQHLMQKWDKFTPQVLPGIYIYIKNDDALLCEKLQTHFIVVYI